MGLTARDSEVHIATDDSGLKLDLSSELTRVLYTTFFAETGLEGAKSPDTTRVTPPTRAQTVKDAPGRGRPARDVGVDEVGAAPRPGRAPVPRVARRF